MIVERSSMKIRKILVVGNSELIHKVHRLYLRSFLTEGTELIRASNGGEALMELARYEDVDLIILDINVPVKDGIEFLIYRQKKNVYQDIPVIIISSKGKESDIAAGMKLGAAGYLVKPYEKKDLEAVIEELFEEGIKMKSNAGPSSRNISQKI